jgi:hypothetical protein
MQKNYLETKFPKKKSLENKTIKSSTNNKTVIGFNLYMYNV